MAKKSMMLLNHEHNRALRIIRQIIGQLKIDLSGLTVLTEVGSNRFIYTPLIAALAGAEKVFAWTRDSRFGKAEDIVAACKQIALEWGVDDKLEFGVNIRPVDHVQQADIITNLNFLRPIDNSLVSEMKSTAVVPYMCEAWEVREGDVDIEACRKKGVQVAGTWENYPGLDVFDYCGPLAVKLLQEAGYEIKNNRILVVSSDHFGDMAECDLSLLGAVVTKKKSLDISLVDVKNTEVIFFCDYTTTDELFLPDEVKEYCADNGISIVHLCGALDAELLLSSGLHVYPGVKGYSKRMTQTLAYLGISPVIRLHAAGLKVGEMLAKKQTGNLLQEIK